MQKVKIMSKDKCTLFKSIILNLWGFMIFAFPFVLTKTFGLNFDSAANCGKILAIGIYVLFILMFFYIDLINSVIEKHDK